MSASRFPSLGAEITQRTIDDYADLSGDYNPLHVDPEVAGASEFGGTIAHGPIAFQPLFRSLTTGLSEQALPTGTTISVTYRAPVRPGDTVTARVKDTDEQPPGGLGLDAECVNQDGVTVLSGSIFLPKDE